MASEHECIVCEVTDPDLFYKGRKTKCKVCVREERSNRYHNKTTQEKKIIAERQVQWQDNNFFSKLSNACRVRAAKKCIDNEMTIEFLEELFEIQHGRCYLTGLPMVTKTRQFNTLSVDRIDNSGGYTRDNVGLCVKWVNVMKSDHSHADFLAFCEAVVAYTRMVK